MTLRRKKEAYIFIVIVSLVIVCCNEYKKESIYTEAICINEVCTKNLSKFNYSDDFYPDGYVELYNRSNKAIDISGWYISNEGRKLLNDNKIENMIIEPFGYLVLPVNSKKKEGINQIILKDIFNSENVALYNKNGSLIDSVNLPVLPIDVAYGRNRDGDDILNLQICTPDTANGKKLENNIISTLSSPYFSFESGFYAEDFWLVLKAKSTYDIYYTLDGSIPTNKSMLYEDPIKICDATTNKNVLSNRDDLSSMDYTIPNELVDKAVVVRAVCYDKDGNKSDIITKTYFVGEHMIEDYANGIATISIVADPDELVGYENGIMNLGLKYEEFLGELGLEEPEDKHDYYVEANFSQRGRGAERNIFFSYYENGELKLEQSVGMRMRGVGSNVGPQKGFAIFPRKLYDGNNRLQYDIFRCSSYAEKAVLKNANIILRDGFYSDILEGRNLPKMYYRPVSVFINGEYWGLYSLFEKYDSDYLRNHYNVDKNSVIIYRNGEITEGEKFYEEDLKDIKERAQTIYEDSRAYNIICDKIDIDSFIDYYCTLIYIDARDNSETDNVMIWKTVEDDNSNSYADGRWRWILYDLDFSMVDYRNDNMSLKIDENRPPFFEQTLLNGLLDSEEFRIKFITTFMDMINFNFNEEKIVPLYMKRAEEIRCAMENQSVRYPDTRASWDEKLERDINFWRERKSYIIKYLQEYFSLGEPMYMEIDLDESVEAVQINSSRIINNGEKISMQYFPGLPVHLSVISKQGYELESWVISGEQCITVYEDEIEVMPENNLKIATVSAVIE